MRDCRSASGTTLVEAIVALGILAGAVTSLAGLAHAAVRAASLSRERSLADVAALDKIESLSRDVRPLVLSPGDTLSADVSGFIEYLDARGAAAAGGDRVFVRRWSVAPVRADPDLLAIQVEVAPSRARDGGRAGDPAARVRLATVRSRLAW